MASLTETAYQTRRIINWTILFVVAYFILRLLWSFFVAFWLIVFPPRMPPPNHAFQKLPRLSYPMPTSSPAAQLKFSLETITGQLPQASSSARVYFMPKATADLLAIPKTQAFAKQLSFDQTPIQESRTVYHFLDPEYPARKLRYDIVSGNFILQYDFTQNTSVFTEGTLRDPDSIQQEAINYLQNYDLYPPDFSQGTQKVNLLKLIGNTLVPVTNLSQTDAIRVDFFRRSVNTFGVVTPQPDQGELEVLFSGSPTQKKRILEVVYTYWPIDYQTFATYNLKPIEQAWQELQSGNGYIARYPTNGDNLARIRNVYLGYYDSFDPQTYLQPIYIFEGDYGFVGYVPAVSPEWVE